jgi:DnaJ-class molecular chaperone
VNPTRRMVGKGEEERKSAHVKFQKLQMAYDVLRDEKKRKLYDRGQLMQ